MRTAIVSPFSVSRLPPYATSFPARLSSLLCLSCEQHGVSTISKEPPLELPSSLPIPPYSPGTSSSRLVSTRIHTPQLRMHYSQLGRTAERRMSGCTRAGEVEANSHHYTCCDHTSSCQDTSCSPAHVHTLRQPAVASAREGETNSSSLIAWICELGGSCPPSERVRVGRWCRSPSGGDVCSGSRRGRGHGERDGEWGECKRGVPKYREAMA